MELWTPHPETGRSDLEMSSIQGRPPRSENRELGEIPPPPLAPLA
jgi:hypothetical protein